MFGSSSPFRLAVMSQELRKVFSDVKKFIGTKKYKEADPEALKKHLDDAFNAIGSSLSDPAAQANVKRYLLTFVLTSYLSRSCFNGPLLFTHPISGKLFLLSNSRSTNIQLFLKRIKVLRSLTRPALCPIASPTSSYMRNVRL